jgi:hypothetical protein
MFFIQQKNKSFESSVRLCTMTNKNPLSNNKKHSDVKQFHLHCFFDPNEITFFCKINLTQCYVLGDANQLDLVGSLYVGSVDYMDPYLQLPQAVWSATLRYGFVGCLKDLYINGASINVVAYAHEQDVGKFFCGGGVTARVNSRFIQAKFAYFFHNTSTFHSTR